VPVESLPPSPLHRPVLLDEVVAWLDPQPGSMLVDGTVGAGGHTAPLARMVAPDGRVIGLDRDPDMLALASQATQGLPVTLVRSPFSALRDVLDELGLDRVSGVLLDLGLASDQLGWAHRGFSFRDDGPLDMRFDPDQTLTAADLVNSLDVEALADLFYQFGEERHSRRIARRIVEIRRTEPIRTTARLAEIVRRSIPGKWGAIDPATRVFQALRIGVNDELEHLDTILKQLADLLEPGGRAVVISFQSLEDRRVKWAFRNDPNLEVLTRKPVTPTADEIHRNPRARSAKLRAAERCRPKISPPNMSQSLSMPVPSH
jgi:16S rRNA (cytosine1402-N4)-methyltransferase